MLNKIGPPPPKLTKHPSFGAKLPTTDILEVITNVVLVAHGTDGVFNVNKTMTGFQSLEVTSKCARELKNQFPILKRIARNAKRFFKAPKDLSKIDKWVAAQIKIIGSPELDVTPIQIDEKDIATIAQASRRLGSK